MKTEIFVPTNFNYKMILALSFTVMFYVKTFSQDCKAKLIVKTDEKKAIIKLNNDLLGFGNVEIELIKGKYVLTLHEPSDLWDAKYFRDTITVSNCSEINLSYHFNSSIYLETNPEDVSVFNKDSLIGNTPLFIPDRFSMITLSKKGYQSRDVSVNENLNNNRIGLKYIGRNNGKSFYEKDIFKILVGSLVVLGGATAYFKLKADNRYESYQSTGEQAYLDQTRKFDLISGITMGALQINFGVLIYYFLTD
jgi:hypothetical protein